MWLTHFWHSWSQFFIFAWDVTAGGILRTGVLICLVPYCGCWWPGDARIQGISCDPVCLEYFVSPAPEGLNQSTQIWVWQNIVTQPCCHDMGTCMTCHWVQYSILVRLTWLNTLRPRQNGRHFPDDIFKWIFVNKNVWISLTFSLVSSYGSN